MITPSQAHKAFTGHRHYPYRGCAPDTDQPQRAAGDLSLSVDAWSPYNEETPETQAARHARERATRAVCSHCPVQLACATYANTTTLDAENGTERLTEPEGMWGGQTALERHRALIARRTDASYVSERALVEARTPQKLALLHALAVELYDDRVAHRAGIDLRAANWQRSALCGLLGLDKETATRDDLLVAAIHHQLLPARTHIVWDGLWPTAAAPTADGARQRRIAPGIPPAVLTPRPQPSSARPRRRVLRSHPAVPPPAPVLCLEPAA
ncbi:WhiB family transcriptional regulator [Streptomyces sp. NPDC059076]|uniref:WhiB family transcriptional regulator n=1 Tax=unclassified Streptomyces TaxID=2593676 RepID=UPI00368D92C1